MDLLDSNAKMCFLVWCIWLHEPFNMSTPRVTYPLTYVLSVRIAVKHSDDDDDDDDDDAEPRSAMMYCCADMLKDV